MEQSNLIKQSIRDIIYDKGVVTEEVDIIINVDGAGVVTARKLGF